MRSAGRDGYRIDNRETAISFTSTETGRHEERKKRVVEEMRIKECKRVEGVGRVSKTEVREIMKQVGRASEKGSTVRG